MRLLEAIGGPGRALASARAVAELQAVADTPSILPPTPVAANTIGLQQIPGLLGGWMSRDTALLIPSFSRGLDVIAGIGAGFPLVELNPAGEPLQPLGFTAQPSYQPGVPNVTLMRQTLSDLVCTGSAWWLISEALLSPLLYPVAVQRIDPGTISPDQADTHWIINGDPVPRTHVIDFATGTLGALHSGWYTLQTALALESAANSYAASPMPSIALRSTGLDLVDDEVQELLDKWETARRTRGTAYLNSQVDTKEFGWNSAELQLVEARQHSAMEVARLLNLDPVWVGASPSGSSLTYTNRQDHYQQLLDGSILPLLRVIEQRLSMLTRGRTFRFDTIAFLRANLSERVTAFTAYIAAGVMTVDEARALEPMLQMGDIPA